MSCTWPGPLWLTTQVSYHHAIFFCSFLCPISVAEVDHTRSQGCWIDLIKSPHQPKLQSVAQEKTSLPSPDASFWARNAYKCICSRGFALEPTRGAHCISHAFWINIVPICSPWIWSWTPFEKIWSGTCFMHWRISGGSSTVCTS